MSNRLAKAYSDDNGSSGKPPYSLQSFWMSKQGSLVVPHSQILSKEQGLHHKQKRMCASLNRTSDIPRYIRAENFRKESSDNISASRIRIDPSCSYDTNSEAARKRNRSSMLVLATNETAISDIQPQSNMKSSEDDAEDFSKAVVISTQFSKNTFAIPDKYNKYSAILFHERNSLSAIVSRNQGDPPLFPRTEVRSFLITKKTGDQIVQNPTHRIGVKIQPLWSSTDSEKDNRSSEFSAETRTMDAVALSNKNDVSGALSPPLVTVSKHTTRDETLHRVSADPKKDKVKGKLPITEIPDINSMDGMEPSTSITQSLEVEHLLPCAEQPSESNPTLRKRERSLHEPSSRWVKRLKPSSSEVGVSSPHEKTHEVRHQSKEVLVSDQRTMRPTMNGESSSRKRKDTIFQCSWIQRWCQDQIVAKHRSLHKSEVICEPDSSKLPFDELEKKQFPSIAAMALMGKSMNGYRPCKLTKRGPLVIWNTEDN